MSLISKVSKSFLKFNKQDGGINKIDLIVKNVQKQPEKIEIIFSMHIKVSVIYSTSLKLKF